jgi:hypothetical protein
MTKLLLFAFSVLAACRTAEQTPPQRAVASAVATAPKSSLEPCTARVESWTRKALAATKNESVFAAEVTLSDRAMTERVNALLEGPVRARWQGARGAVALTVSCEPHHYGPLVSVGCEVYENQGGAHPSLGFMAQNVWLCGPKLLQLDDLCDGSPRCRKGIERAVRSHLPSDIAATIFDDCPGCKPSPLDVFELTSGGIRFSFHEQLGHALVGKYGLLELPFAELDRAFAGAASYAQVRDAARSR